MKNTTKIKSVYKSVKWYSLLLENSTYCSLETKSNVIPSVGDSVTIYRDKNYCIKKIDINGATVNT